MAQVAKKCTMSVFLLGEQFCTSKGVSNLTWCKR